MKTGFWFLLLVSLLSTRVYAIDVHALQKQKDEVQEQQRLEAARQKAIADEQSAWDAAERRNTLEAYKAFVARFGQGKHAAQARNKIEAMVADIQRKAEERDQAARDQERRRELEAWKNAVNLDSERGYAAYLEAYPQGTHAEQAYAAVLNMYDRMDDLAWSGVQSERTTDAVSEYLRRYDNISISVGRGLSRKARHVEESDRLLQQLAREADDREWQTAEAARTIDAVNRYLTGTGSEGLHHEQAETLLGTLHKEAEERDWKEALASNSSEKINSYLAHYGATSRHAYEAWMALKSISDAEDDSVWKAAEAVATADSLKAYMRRYIKGRHFDEAEAALGRLLREDEKTDWAALDKKSSAALLGYAQKYPQSGYRAELLQYLEKERIDFKDCSSCPRMVVLPAGSFRMGNKFSDKYTQHVVTINHAFAVGQFPVTRKEYSAFVRDSGYRTVGVCDRPGSWSFDGNWSDTGFEQGADHPVVCLNWEDAVAYAKWLSDKTGRKYRLLSDSEYEYAARAGKQSSYWWGENGKDACEHENLADLRFKKQYPNGVVYMECDDSFVYTSPVGKFKPNGFGLYDMSGNAESWVADCWNEDLTAGPVDGAAWLAGDCSERVIRGHSWQDFSPTLGNRRGYPVKNYSMSTLGVRIARDYP